MSDSYQTLDSLATGEYKEKGSKFIAYAQAIYTEAEGKNFLQSIKKKHPKARHHCYAFSVGLDKQKISRANDDGEPSGSAGRPILGQIRSKELSNIMAVVVRYFGGTKLGVPGLIRAYKTATRDALDNAKIVDKKVMDVYEISFNYVEMNTVMRFLKQENINIIKQYYDSNCKINICVRQSLCPSLLIQLHKIKDLKTKYLHTT